MTLSERSRAALYNRLTDVVGDEEAVSEMLSYFPSRDVEEPLTKEFFRAEMAIAQAETQAEFAAVRAEMAEGFSTVWSEFARLRAEMAEEFSVVRGEMSAGDMTIREEMRAGDAAIREEMLAMEARLTAEIHAGFQRQMVWSVSTMLAFATVLIGAFALLG